MQRRHFIRTLLSGAAFSALGLRPANAAGAQFAHGVASGDPLDDRVILWTRVSGVQGNGIEVGWAVAEDEAMSSIVASGVTSTDAGRDYTVKVDATGLPPGRKLFYRFDVGGVSSPVGRTRTLPAGSPTRAAFAVVSCSNHPYGYFHVYRDIASRDDLDAVIHLGDYIYEYGLGGYATELAERLGRVPEPRGGLVTLDDYRRRHAQYKADPDSIAMHGSHPLIPVWDDHELANDAWRGGAQNHSDEQGAWDARRDAAIQAWLEWMPVRVTHDRGNTRTFRDFRYGDLLSLIMLDTRMYGRDLQPDAGPDVTFESVKAAMGDPERRLLGRRQEAWLRRALARADGTTWQVIGQQVMVSPTLSPDLEPLLDLERESMLPPERLQGFVAASKGNPPMLLDTWNGYPAARQDFLTDLYEHASNPVILSGDLHTSLAGNLVPWGHSSPVAVELMTTSVTSPGFAEYLPEAEPNAVRDATLAINPSLAYMETERRGWLYVKLDREKCVGEWNLIDTVHAQEHSFSVDKRLAVSAGQIRDGLREA
ncbi:MAG: alkaline phosphatase D family protein [Woeseiaceae bacterium]|nr:alkaline phosphatase D family protein [Woeseiaceae bacterium]